MSVKLLAPTVRLWAQNAGAVPAGGRPVRLWLSRSTASEVLDGAWWPYSHDLRTEALALTNHFPASLGRILRLIYCAADWTGDPGRVRADNVFVTLASFRDDVTSRVLLRTDWGRRVFQLLVVPPEWEDRAARYAMRIAATPTSSKSAATILAESNDEVRLGLLAHWEDDGGKYASR